MSLRNWKRLAWLLTVIGIVLCLLCLVLFGDGERGRYVLLGSGLGVALLGIVFNYAFCRCPSCGSQLGALNKVCPKCGRDLDTVDSKPRH